MDFQDETFRDGPQSLWATRMRTESMLGIARTLDDAGFAKACVLSAASFETAVKFLYEDPWERLRLLCSTMRKTPLNILIRGRNLFGWRRYPDDVVELLLTCFKRIGIKWIKVFDALNDMRNIEWHIRVGKELGLRVSGIIGFNVSPVHTDEYFVAKAKELMGFGIDNLIVGDAPGTLTPERTRTLIPALRRAIGDGIPLELSSHGNTGLAGECYREAMRLGVDILHTAALPLAYGESVPATTDMVGIARDVGVEVGVNEQRLKEVDDYFFWVAYQEKKPIGRRVQFTPREYEKYVAHQIPGGMMSNLVNQLSELGLLHLLPAVLEESGRVRQEVGYPVMVTPFSQLVGVQATLNVIEGERYRTVPQELRLYARGYYGEPAAPIDPNVLDRILGSGEREPMDPTEGFLDPFVSKFRAEQGPFASDEELLLAIFYGRQSMGKFHANKRAIDPRPVVPTPLAALVTEVSARRGIRSVRIEKGPLQMTQSSSPSSI